MTDMPDASKLQAIATEVKDALATLQQSGKGTHSLAEDTKRNVEAFMTKYEKESAEFTRKWTDAQNEKKAVEEKAAKLEAELLATKKDTDEYKKRVEHLEMIFAKKGRTGEDKEIARETPEYKNFFGWFAYHPKKSDSVDIDFKTLRTDSETQGAYLIPQIMDNEIRKNIVEMSPVRAYARNRVAPGKTMDIPRRLTIPIAYFEGEAEQDTSDQSQYGSEQVTLFRQSITIPATLDMMVSSAFDLEREISSDVGEAFGVGEGRGFLTGSGVKGPQGIVSDNRITVVDTAASGAIDFNDMAEIAGKLKRGQNPMWFMNRRSLAKMWQIKSSIGVPIWTPVAGNSPATIWGFPYSSDMIDMDDAQTGAGAKPIIFGDMRRGYEIFDMLGISVIRDDLTKKRQAITEWTFRRYLTGRVIIPEAFKIMRVKA